MNAPSSFVSPERLKILVLWALALGLAIVAVGQAWAIFGGRPLGIDFLPLWTAGRLAWTSPGHAYDFAVVTNAQRWLMLDLAWPRPYVYPPTALLLLAPLGKLPFWTALGLWVALGFGLFLYAGARLARERRRLALALMPVLLAVVLATLVGQSVLLVTGLATIAVLELDRRPKLAGALFALAAVIKPQAVLLAPVALLAAGATEALVSAAVAGTALVALSMLVFGPQRWTEWLGALTPFQAVIETTPHMMWGVITPFGLAHELGLSDAAAILLRVTFALGGLALVWRAFSRPGPPATRLVALLGGGLLVAPYAMQYDATLLVPAAVALAVERLSSPGWPLRMLGLVAVSEVATPHWGAVAVVVFILLSSGDLLRGAASPAPKPRAQARGRDQVKPLFQPRADPAP